MFSEEEMWFSDAEYEAAESADEAELERAFIKAYGFGYDEYMAEYPEEAARCEQETVKVMAQLSYYSSKRAHDTHQAYLKRLENEESERAA